MVRCWSIAAAAAAACEDVLINESTASRNWDVETAPFEATVMSGKPVGISLKKVLPSGTE